MPRATALTATVVVAAALAAAAGPAGAHPLDIGVEVGVQDGTLRVAPTGRELGVVIDQVAGPCALPTRETEDYGSPKHVLEDAAGCVTFDVRDRDPGPGCTIVDREGGPLTACGLGGVRRVEVRGGAADDRVLFLPGYAFGGETMVDLGDGDDRVEAVDGAVERIACGPGETDTSTEDAADVGTDCEAGNGLDDAPAGARNGRIERRDGKLVADFRQARGNTLHRLAYDISGRPDEHAVGFGLYDQGLPSLGEGCGLRRGDPLCRVDGVHGLDVLGPERRTRDLLSLETSFTPGAIDGPVTLHAGPGEAVLTTKDGIGERVDCGLGYDRVYADRQDVVEASCEVAKGEGTLAPQPHGVVAARARTVVGTLPFYYNNQGQGVWLRVRCPASARSGCGGIMEVTLSRPPRLSFGANGFAIDPGKTGRVGIAGAVDRSGFHAAAEGPVRRRFQRELRRYGNLRLDVVAAHGFGAHRTQRTFHVTAGR